MIAAMGQVFPQVHSKLEVHLSRGQRSDVLALRDCIERIAPALIPLDGRDYVQLIIRLHYLRDAVDYWATENHSLCRASGSNRNVV